VTFPWAPGSATGIGSLPGTDITEAVKSTFGELPLPYLPELPARGPGADMIGRTAGLLVEIPVDLYVAQWRVAAHPGRDLRRTRDLWDRDLDVLTEHAADFDGLVKLQVAGPWTLAAAIDLPIGGRMLRDPGAVRDLTSSLAEGVAQHIADVRRRLPHARVLMQLDEPSLPAVLAGRVPTESGYGTLRAVDVTRASSALRDVVAAATAAEAAGVVVHCCAPDVPLSLIHELGVTAVAVDLDLMTDLDALGEVLDAGLGLFAGAVPSMPPAPVAGAAESRSAAISTDGGRAARTDFESGRDDAPQPSPMAIAAANRVKALWREIGFSPNHLATQVVITPACGLAGVSPTYARAATAACREAATRLADS
jgi:methionine synthase II (cobalamin-independent)